MFFMLMVPSSGLFSLVNTTSTTPPTSFHMYTINKPEAVGNAPPLLLNIVWHQHQPVYVNPATNQAELPWVFMHSIKDYDYMINIVPQDVNVTFDLTGSLLQQIMNYYNYMANRNISGAFTDKRIEIALTPVANMTYDQKVYEYNYFFDINSQFIAKSGRYTELANKKGTATTLAGGVASFTDQDWQDLKALFFLDWLNWDYTVGDSTYGVNPDPVLNTFYTSYSGVSTGSPKFYHPFSEANITYIIEFGLNILQQVIPDHKAAIAQGNVEVVTSPLDHPILPLLINLTSARDTSPGNANLPLPVNKTGWTSDAAAQLNLSYALYQKLFGVKQVGLWPSEEAVSPAILPLVNQTGVTWLITDQQQLQKVLPTWSDTANQTYKDHLLYQPYIIQDSVSGKSEVTVYRNTAFSDLIGFSYQGLEPSVAASDFVSRLKTIYDEFNSTSTSSAIKDTTHVVTIALDGENAWESYSWNGQFTGNAFLRAFYSAIEGAQNAGWLKTITMQQYLQKYGTNGLSTISVQRNQWVGSWVGGDLNTWIGEPEENTAWDRLINVRDILVQANTTDPNRANANYTRAWEILYQAEGSDWTWWYGSDQNSGHDELFDWIYKLLLRGVLNETGWSDQQILDQFPFLFVEQKPPVLASVAGYINPTLDGVVGTNEWTNGASFSNGPTTSSTIISQVYTGYNSEGNNLSFRIDVNPNINLTTENNLFIALYMSNTHTSQTNTYVRYQPIIPTEAPLGIDIGWELGFNFTGTKPTSFTVYKADGSNGWVYNTSFNTLGISSHVIEFTVPFAALDYAPVDNILMNFVAFNGTPLTKADIIPQSGPWSLVVPSGKIPGIVLFTMQDALGDDAKANPLNDGTESTIIYPTAPIFQPGYGHFDINTFTVATDTQKKINSFQVSFATSTFVVDPSWATPTFTLQYVQIYVDTDNIPGSGRTDTIQNANMVIEPNHAWEFMINCDGETAYQYILFANGTKVPIPNQIVGDQIAKTITASFSQSITGAANLNWKYVVLVGSKDYQAFRQVNAGNALWVVGGRSDSSWDPNVIDMLTPPGMNQEDLFGNYSIGNYLATAYAVGPGIAYVVDTIPPVVSILSPSNGSAITAVKSVASIFLSWNASDNVGLSRAEIYLNQVLVQSLKAPASNTTILWYENGNFVITLRWYDIGDKNYADATTNITISGIPAGTNNPYYSVPKPTDVILNDLANKGSPGFEFVPFMLAIPVIAVIYLRRRKR